MARPKKTQTIAEQIEQMEAIVLQRKAACDEAVSELKNCGKSRKRSARMHY